MSQTKTQLVEGLSINTSAPADALAIGNNGEFGIAGNNYGTSGQVLTSQGSGSAPQWSTIATDKIEEGNTSVECVDTGSNGHITFDTEGSEAARFDSSGRLLVGTSSYSGVHKLVVKARTDDSTLNAGLVLQRGSTPSAAGQAIGYIQFQDQNANNGAYIYAESDAGAWTSGSNHRSRLVLSTTANGGSSPSERMRITSTGQLLSNTTTDNAAVRAYFSGDNWGGGTGSGTVTGSSLPQFLFDRCGLDNSGSVTPIGFNIRGGGGGVPRGLCFAAHGSYQGNSAANHNVFFVRNVGNTGQTWNTVNGAPGVGIQAGTADAYAGPHASAWWTPSFAAQFGIKDETTNTYDGGFKVGQTIELGGTYAGGTPGNWGGTCLAVRIATNFGTGSNGTNFGYRANISGAGSGNNWGIYIDAGNAAKPGGGSWSSTSDERVKTVNASYAKGLSEVTQLNPVKFTYNGKAETPDDGQEYVGLLAQEVQQVLPDMVTSRRAKLEETDEEETDILMVDPSELVYTLINACKELKTQVDDLTARLAALESA